jgi:hypothetical protein
VKGSAVAEIGVGRRMVGCDNGSHLGFLAVEGTMSRLNSYRRLKVRYERQGDVHQAFLEFRCALILWRNVKRFVLGTFSGCSPPSSS